MNNKQSLFFGIALAIAVALVLGFTNIDYSVQEKNIPTFDSCQAITNAFKESQSRSSRYYETLGIGAPKAVAEQTSTADAESTEYSQTNIQVEGVDEADIVKTDGEYIYTISNGKITITKAYPAEDLELISIINLNFDYPSEIFIHKDKLLVFSQGNIQFGEGPVLAEEKIASSYYYPRTKTLTIIEIFDISDKENPELEKKLEFEGDYLSSRKIDEYVYFIVRSYPDYRILEEPIPKEEDIIPLYREETNNIGNDFEPVARCAEIGYLEPVEAQSFITLASVSMEDLEKTEKKTVIGSGENVYASQDNLYIAESHYQYIGPLLVRNEETENKETTTIHKFSIDNGNIDYKGSMEAKGHILNQFSMDEFNNDFRIATTIGQVSRVESKSTNNIYIFDEDLKLKGSLEDLAPGEQIYSARFIGEKAYLVTFKKIDPLFVIDLSNPGSPKILGKLKIPGYSDYLHPIDSDHIIGIGKEAVEAEEGDFAWYQGIKIAIFDVSDVENPKEMFKEVIGDRGTDSYALHDHKAFLYDKEKELLVIPVLLAEYKEEPKESWGYGEFTFQGAYVYNLDLEDGFELKGKITHLDSDETFEKAGYYYWGGGEEVKRSLYIDDTLYTISDTKILANSLEDLELIKEIVINTYDYDKPKLEETRSI